MKTEFYADVAQMLLKRLSALVYEYDVIKDIMIFINADCEKRIIKSYRQKLYRTRRTIVHPDFMDKLSALIAGHSIDTGPILLDLSEKPSGKFYWHEVINKPMLDAEGHVIKTMGIIWKIDSPYDIDSNQRFRSDQDPVTGLLNERGVKKSIENYLIEDGKELMHAIIKIKLQDMDPSKYSNIKADKLNEYALNSLGQQLRNVFRANDLLAYVDDQVFLVFMKNIKTEDIVKIKMDAVARLLENCHMIFCVPKMNYSMGEAIYPVDGNDYNELIESSQKRIRYHYNEE